MLGVVVSPARPPSENINDKERKLGNLTRTWQLLGDCRYCSGPQPP